MKKINEDGAGLNESISNTRGTAPNAYSRLKEIEPAILLGAHQFVDSENSILDELVMNQKAIFDLIRKSDIDNSFKDVAFQLEKNFLFYSYLLNHY